MARPTPLFDALAARPHSAGGCRGTAYGSLLWLVGLASCRDVAYHVESSREVIASACARPMMSEAAGDT